MKKILILSVIFVFSFFFVASAKSGMKKCFEKSDIVSLIHENHCELIEETLASKDCVVRLDIELEDGTTIQGEVVFMDVSWRDCTKIKLADWRTRNF